MSKRGVILLQAREVTPKFAVKAEKREKIRGSSELCSGVGGYKGQRPFLLFPDLDVGHDRIIV